MTPPVAPPARTFGPVSRTDIVRYQGASGDMQPVHHDEPYAQSAGAPTVFSVGMLQAGVLAGWAADWLGARNVRSIRLRLREQVWPGDVLTCSGSIVDQYERDGEQLVDVDLQCVRQTGGIAVQGRATFVVRDHAARTA